MAKSISHFSEGTVILHKLIMLAYHQRCDETSLPDGWKFYKDSKGIKNTLGYYGQVWINQETRKFILVSAGTKADFYNIQGAGWTNLFGIKHLLLDLFNDFQIYMHWTPTQFARGVQKFIDYVALDPELIGYDIICTGHSMGAKLSALGSLYLNRYKEKFCNITSITFENPGSEPAIQSLLREMKTKGHIDEDFNPDPSKHTVINNEENWINTVRAQFGLVYKNNKLKYQKPEFRNKLFSLLPGPIKSFIEAALHNFHTHDIEHFSELDVELHQEKWPVGAFSNYTHKKLQPITNTISCITTCASNIRTNISDTAHNGCEIIRDISATIEQKASYVIDACFGAIGDLFSFEIGNTLLGETDNAIFNDLFYNSAS